MNLWNRDTQLLLALVLLGGLFAVLHVAVWLHALRAPKLRPLWRWLAILPPITPLAGFMSGARGLSVMWCIVAGAYLVLRSYA